MTDARQSAAPAPEVIGQAFAAAPASQARQTLTVVIPTKNAAHLLPDCLDSVSFADEIIVVDMFSTDETERLCERYPQCRLIQREDYIFGNVNHGFGEARGDWVMRLDSDERITTDLAKEVVGILSDPPEADVTGYEFWERPIVLGRELRNGFGRQHWRKMMFRRGRARYAVRSEHEDLEATGLWRRTRHGYLHHNYTSVAQYLQKMDYYTSKDVERITLPEAAPPVRVGVVDTARAFYLYYGKLRGYRDGWVGFVDAGMRATYQFVSWAKQRERWEREVRR